MNDKEGIFELFRKTDRYLLEQLKEQASVLCRYRITPQRIEQSFANFEFGFVHKTTPVASIGTTPRTHHNSYRITSFVLCKPYPAGNVDVELLCSGFKKNEKKKLLNVVENYSREQGYPDMSISSLPKKKSIDWYKSQGFEIIHRLRDMKTRKLKGYLMMKKL